MIEAETLRADAALFLVDRPRINAALSYCAINAAEIPVGFVFTDLGDWTVTLSHEVLELIVDSTLGFFLAEPEARTRVRREGMSDKAPGTVQKASVARLPLAGDGSWS